MTVAALANYCFPSRDVAANFLQPLLYVAWDEHMMFCAPLAVLLDGQTKFSQVRDDLLPRLYGEHPDFSRIDWARVQWFQSSRIFTPQPSQSMATQGFKHKSVLRFRTPGLEGIRGSCG
jgi:phenol/toluene 2-monooxygenase (NADH) P4/A4